MSRAAAAGALPLPAGQAIFFMFMYDRLVS